MALQQCMDEKTIKGNQKGDCLFMGHDAKWRPYGAEGKVTLGKCLNNCNKVAHGVKGCSSCKVVNTGLGVTFVDENAQGLNQINGVKSRGSRRGSRRGIRRGRGSRRGSRRGRGTGSRRGRGSLRRKRR